MEELINISDQKLYYSNVESIIKEGLHFDKCAIVVDEPDLCLLLDDNADLIGEKIDQIIVVGEKLSVVFTHLYRKDVFLLSALDLKEAIRFVIISRELTKEIVFVSNQDKESIKQLIDSVVISS